MSFDITKGMIETMKALPDNTLKAAQRGFNNATDLADYLVKKGMTFRHAQTISGSIVADCIKNNEVLETLPLEAYKKYSEVFEDDLYNEIDLKTCVEKRISEGGTSVSSVIAQIKYVKEVLNK